MEKHWATVLSAGVFAVLLFWSADAHGDDASREVRETGGVRVELGVLRITNSVLELRCEICNETGEDIWVCTDRPGSSRTITGTKNADVFIGQDDQILVVLRRMSLPYHGAIPESLVSVSYARLRPGERRPEVLAIPLPLSLLAVITDGERGMAQAIEGGVESFGRLAFEVGYFTERQLRSIEAGPGPLHVRRNESADEVVIRGLITPSEYRSEERSVRVALDGVRLPYKEWIGGPENPYPSERAATIVRGIRRFFEYYGGGGCGEDRYAESLLTIDEDLFDDTARQLVDVYAECARGRVLPAELLSLVDKILSQEERQKLLEELWEKKRRMQPSRFPPVQALEDAFYNSSLDYDQYRYARRLFDIDADLLDDPARRIKGVYVEVAYGKLDAAALAAALDEILRDDDRERLLAELEAKQADAEQARRTRVAELLAAARRCASPAEGHKALALLAEAMTIDSSNNEVFELMRNVSAFYQGQVVTNSIGMQLVWIPAGEFVMGKKGRPFDTLVHKVRVSGGFWMGVREVRQAQYEAVMATNPSTEKAGARPVTDVSWNDAVEFCRRLSEKEGKTYRLPTEAEWEYAYRAGTNTDYWWGDDEHAIPDAPNPFGLLNMHGGVREWCQDWHSNGYYFVSPDLDPPGPAEPEGECVRVVRGDVSIRGEAWGPGWWRGRDEPVETHRNVGFRVVLDES